MVWKRTIHLLFGVFMVCGCMQPTDYDSGQAQQASAADGLAFPNFPLYYSGIGVFHDLADPQNTLIGTYTFDMERGVNHEFVNYIDHNILAMHFYDLDPSDGTDPDREYFIELDERGRPESCSLAPFPLPNIFLRDWWLHNNMVYVGQETINGYLADCWEGVIPEFGAPARFCNRASVYPDFAPLEKQVATFVFRDYNGEVLTKKPKPRLFKLPRVCRGL